MHCFPHNKESLLLCTVLSHADVQILQTSQQLQNCSFSTPSSTYNAIQVEIEIGKLGMYGRRKNQSCANNSSLSSRRLAAFSDEAMETWVDKFPLTVKLEEADLQRLVDVVLRKSPFWIPPVTFFGTIPRAKHMTSARLLKVLVADLPDDLRTRMLTAPASIPESIGSRNSPDVVATSSLTWRTRLGTADVSLSTSS